MLFSRRDIDLLRLLCWCQYASYGDLKAASSEAEVKNLIGCGMMKWYNGSRTLVLAKRGKQMLCDLYGDELPSITPTYHANAIRRRLRLSRLII